MTKSFKIFMNIMLYNFYLGCRSYPISRNHFYTRLVIYSKLYNCKCLLCCEIQVRILLILVIQRHASNFQVYDLKLLRWKHHRGLRFILLLDFFLDMHMIDYIKISIYAKFNNINSLGFIIVKQFLLTLLDRNNCNYRNIQSCWLD